MNEETTPATGEATRATLADLLARFDREASGANPPPVETWNPADCGEIDIRISAEGVWYHCGSPIGRPAMVRLFSSLLRRDPDGRTYLVTPVEKCAITVEDVPFVAVELQVVGSGEAQRLALRTNVDDVVAVDAAHPLRFAVDPANGGLKPYVLVRGRLEARLSRPVLYDLVELGEAQEIDGRGWFGVRSEGTFFPILPADELEAAS